MTMYFTLKSAVIPDYEKFNCFTSHQQSSQSIKTFFILRLVSIHPEIYDKKFFQINIRNFFSEINSTD